jgi:hypothetical protein
MFTVKAPRNPNRPDRRQVPRHLEDRGFEPRVREREFGIGYGRSSGYVRSPSYLPVQAGMFRCR